MSDRPPQRWMFHFEDENRFIEGGHLFTRERDLGDPVVYLHCQRRDNAQCMARGTWINNTFTYTSLPDPVTGQYHFHLPDFDLEREYLFARALHRAVTHCYTPIRIVYNCQQGLHRIAAAILGFDRMSSTLYRWRAVMQPPQLLSYRDVVETLTNNEWNPIFSRIQANMDAVLVESPSGSHALVIGDRPFLRRFPINDLYICNTVFSTPRLQGTQSLLFVMGRYQDGHAFVLTWALMNANDAELYTAVMHSVQDMMPVNTRPPRLFCSPQVSQILRGIYPESEIMFTYDEIMRGLVKAAQEFEGINIHSEQHRQMLCNIATSTFEPSHMMEDALRYVWVIMPLELRIIFQPLIERFHYFCHVQFQPDQISLYRKDDAFNNAAIMYPRVLRRKTRRQGLNLQFWPFFNAILETVDEQWVALDRLNANPPRVVNNRMPTIDSCFIDMAQLHRLWDLHDEAVLPMAELLRIGRHVQRIYVAELIMNRDHESATFALPEDRYPINMAGRLHMPNLEDLFGEVNDAAEDIVRLANDEHENAIEMIIPVNGEEVNHMEVNQIEGILGGHELDDGVQPAVRLDDDGHEGQIIENMVRDEPVHRDLVPLGVVDPVGENADEERIPMAEGQNPGDGAIVRVIGANFNPRCHRCEVRLAEYISVECMCLVYCDICVAEILSQVPRNVPLNADCPMCREPVLNFEKIFIPTLEDETTYDFACVICTDAPMQMISKPCNQLTMCIRCAVTWEQAQLIAQRCPSCNLVSTYHLINIREENEDL